MSKRPYFRTAFGNQRVNEFQKLLISARHYYYPIFQWIWDKLSGKKSVWLRWEILGFFVYTLAAEYKYSYRNMQTFAEQVQTPLSLKIKSFSRLFSSCLKSFWNLEDFIKKGESFSFSISDIIDSERSGYLSV